MLNRDIRFNISLFLFLHFSLNLEKETAKRLSATLISKSKEPFIFSSVEDLVLNVEKSHHSNIKNRGDYISDLTDEIMTSGSINEKNWLISCAGMLFNLIGFVASENVAGQAQTISMLASAGWRDVIAHFIARMQPILTSNIAPHSAPLSRQLKRFLDRQKNKTSRHQK